MKRFARISKDADAPLPCPACARPVSDVRYAYSVEERTADFYRCSCGFIFARPVLIPELSQRQMDGVENAEMFNSPLLKRLYEKLFIEREIRRIRSVRSERGLRLLDIGCGTGWTTKIYQDHGFRVTGLEPSPVRAQLAREKYGLEIINDYLENLSECAERYDVIVLRHIIEHFAAPEEIMLRVRDLLADDGVVLVIVPNINCLGRYLFGTNWAWILPWHCNFFTPASTRLFLQRLGFRVLTGYQTPSPLYLPGSLLRVLPFPPLQWLVQQHRPLAILASAPFALFGTLLGLGDNINLLASKVR